MYRYVCSRRLGMLVCGMTARRSMVASLALALTLALGALGALVAPGVLGARLARADTPRDADVLAQIDRVVRAKFYSPDVLSERRWDDNVRVARKAFDKASPAKRHQILATLVASLRTSHTEYLSPDDPRFAQLL